MKHMELNFYDPKRLQMVARALASEVRLNILQLLDECSMNIAEIAQRLGLPMSTVSNNVVILEEAGLIRTERQNGVHGQMKLCSRRTDDISFQLHKPQRKRLSSFFYQMPIGHYTDCRVAPTCGLLGLQSNIGEQDDPATFYDENRFNAQLLWFQQGYVEYRFSNQLLKDHTIKCIEISFEACSEAPNYRADYPSDITVWLNGVELGTWRCPGDFGGRQGHYTPDWWSLSSTQYGLLKRWRVNEHDCTLDDVPISGVNLKQLSLADRPYISLRIGVRPDAVSQGGINLFGEHFGDYQQAIIMRVDCIEKDTGKGD